jgi:hypothetical protein
MKDMPACSSVGLALAVCLVANHSLYRAQLVVVVRILKGHDGREAMSRVFGVGGLTGCPKSCRVAAQFGAN